MIDRTGRSYYLGGDAIETTIGSFMHRAATGRVPKNFSAFIGLKDIKANGINFFAPPRPGTSYYILILSGKVVPVPLSSMLRPTTVHGTATAQYYLTTGVHVTLMCEVFILTKQKPNVQLVK